MAQIRNRFTQLLAQVQLETGKKPTYQDIQEATGIAASTLSSYAQGTVKRYDENTLMALVDYFNGQLAGGCRLSDLLEYPPVPSQELSYATATATA